MVVKIMKEDDNEWLLGWRLLLWWVMMGLWYNDDGCNDDTDDDDDDDDDDQDVDELCEVRWPDSARLGAGAGLHLGTRHQWRHQVGGGYLVSLFSVPSKSVQKQFAYSWHWLKLHNRFLVIDAEMKMDLDEDFVARMNFWDSLPFNVTGGWCHVCWF